MLFQSTLSVVLSILTIAAVLSLVAVSFGIITRRRYPSIEHACWVIVLLRMIVPPMVPLTVPGFPTRPSVQSETRPELVNAPNRTMMSVRSTAHGSTAAQEEVAAISNPVFVNDDESVQQPQMLPMATPVVAVEVMPAIERPIAAERAVAVDAEQAVAANAAGIAPSNTDIARSSIGSIASRGSWSRPHASSILISLWALGSTVVLLRAFQSMWRFRRLMRLSEPVSGEIQSAGERVAKRVGLKRTPTIRSLRANIPPMVWTRVGRALVVLPRDFNGVACPTQRDLLLTHEFAHLKRRDHLVRWLELFTMALWWWCPLIWIVRSRLRQVEESACDAWVMRIWPEQSAPYAQVIVDTVGFVAGQSRVGPLTTGGLGSLRNLGARIKAIQSKQASAAMGIPGAIGLLSLALLTCPFMLVGQSVLPSVSAAAQATDTTAGEENKDDGEATDPPTLPPQLDPLYPETAPDKKKIAFVGNRVREDGSSQYGLFIFDIESKKTTCLIEKALKTRPGWSPDSTKLAIGNSPGYGNVYPLVIVDVVTGKIDETGVQGAGAAWSPDGRYVAVSTGFGRAGSWSAGIPCDGRIGIWDTKTRELTYISPAGINLATRDHQFSFMSGGVHPKWSNSGQWIAWQQRLGQRQHGERSDSKSQVWVARRDSEQPIRAFEASNQFRWADDEDVLIDLVSSTKVAVSDLTANASDWPTTPADLKRMREHESNTAASAAKFDAKPVLEANRLWQNPRLDGIDSIEFTHRMAPTRLDERFLWRKDGTNLVEVTRRDDEPKSYGIGWSVLKTGDGASFTQSNQDSLPRYRSPQEITKQNSRQRLSAQELLRRGTLRHLSGSRLNFAAIDWGRNPGDFVISDFQTDGKHRTIELRVKSGLYRRAILNAGAMFETTSWSYIHDVRYDRSVLTIDENDRIIRDVAYSKDKVIADIELLDWVATDAGQAPQHVVMKFPENHGFVVDQRFRVSKEGLWILQSGTSKFEASDAQREEIVDLKINGSTDVLTRRLQKAKRLQRELESDDHDATEISVKGLTPLELGAAYQFPNDSGPSSLTFLPHDASSGDGAWPKSALCAELRYTQEMTGADNPNLMVALYDDKKLPLYVATIPQSAVSMSGRDASDVIAPLLESHQLWLRGTHAPQPKTSYTFRVADRETQVELPSTKLSFSRGLTLTLGLDHVLFAPQKWKMPVAFTADWNGRSVRVIGLTGPSFKSEFGSGIDGTYIGGYSSSAANSLLLVIDKETGFPLVERTPFMEFQFLNYVEAAPGQFVPLRVLGKTAGNGMDLRFQALDGKLWLLDHKVQPDGGSAAGLSNVKIDGNPAMTRLRCETPDGDGSVAWFQWDELSNRRSEQTSDTLSASLAATVEPWTHPSWDLLRGLSVASQRDGQRVVRVQFNPWPYVGAPKYWTLTNMVEGTPKPSLCRESLSGDATKVTAYDMGSALGDPALNETRTTKAISVSAVAAEKTRVKSFQVAQEPNHLAILTPEILSTTYTTDQQVRVTAVVVNKDGVAVAGGLATDSFRTYGEPIVSSDAKVALLNSDRFAGKSILIGTRTDVTGMPMGSVWGRIGKSDPEFDATTLLSSRYAEVRLAGLRQLYQRKWRDISRHFDRGRDDRRVMQTLAPYRAALASVLSGDHGDSGEAIAIACRLAGYSQNRELIAPMRTLLNHESSTVQNGALIGLGLLGEKNANRLDQLAEKAKSVSSTHPLESRLAKEVQWAMR